MMESGHSNFILSFHENHELGVNIINDQNSDKNGNRASEKSFVLRRAFIGQENLMPVVIRVFDELLKFLREAHRHYLNYYY